MSPSASKLLEDALKLPVEARAALAGSLLESLDETSDDTAEADWAVEIVRRMEELESGSVRSIPWAEARRRIVGG